MKETNKKTLAKLIAMGLLLGGTGAVAVSQASADAVSQDDYHPPQMHQGPDFMQKVTRTVEKIDDGVVITLTTDDANTLKKLQDFAANPDRHHGPLHELQNVTRTVVQLDNGVQITLTSDDAETVQKLQEGPRGGDRHPLPSNVNRSVENIDNGIVITLTSDDPETVKMLQEHQ